MKSALIALLYYYTDHVVLAYISGLLFTLKKFWRKYLQEGRIFLAAYYRSLHGLLWFMGVIVSVKFFVVWCFYIGNNIDWIKKNLSRIRDPNDNGIIFGMRIGVLIYLIFHGLSSLEAMKYIIEKLVG